MGKLFFIGELVVVNARSVVLWFAAVAVAVLSGCGTGTVSAGPRTGAQTQSNDASLSALSLSAGALSPSFGSTVTTYTMSVANSVTSTTVTPVTNNAGASVTVNGAAVASGTASGAISLAVGGTVISVAVTAADGTTHNTYTIAVARQAAAQVCATPTFSPGGGAYASGVSVTVSSATSGAAVYCGTVSPPTTVCSGPVAVSSSTTLYALAKMTGWGDSAVSSASYSITAVLPACATAPLRTSPGTVHYFCSSGGSDANDGLYADNSLGGTHGPKASWSAAILTFNSMPAGDTVALCRGGSWTGATATVYNTNCQADSTCDFRDYGTGNLPVINFNGQGNAYLFAVNVNGHDEGYRWWNIDIENGGQEIDWIFANDVSDVDICNISVHGGELAIQDQGGVAGQGRNNRITVRNSAFSNQIGDALLVASSNFTVDSNVFLNCGNSSSTGCATHCHTIYFQEEDIGARSETAGMETQNIRITNNTITMDSKVTCGSEMIHIAGRQNNGLVENNYMLSLSAPNNSCEGIQASASGYSTAAWFRQMTYRRNRIFLLEAHGPSQVGIALDSHGTVASDVSGQSVYTLNQAVAPAIVADNIIVLGGSFPAGIIYQANDSAASLPGDVTSGIITYNNSIYFPNAQNGSFGITTSWGSGSGDSYVMQNNAVYAPGSTCISNPQGYLAGRSMPNYCRTADGDTNGLSTDALSAVWTDAASTTSPNFSLPPGSPLIGAGSTTDFDPDAIAPADVTWAATDLAESRTAPIDIGAVSSH